MNRSGLGTSGDTLRTYKKFGGVQTFEPDEEYFVIVNRRHFAAKISREMPALPHACAKNYNSTQIFVVKTTPQILRYHRDRRGLQSNTS
jgi:hypothetical protein